MHNWGAEKRDTSNHMSWVLSPLLREQFAPRLLVSHPYVTANDECTVKVPTCINSTRYSRENINLVK